MGAFVDHAGKTYGHLTVEERVSSDRNGRTLWRCRCACGAVRDFRIEHVVNRMKNVFTQAHFVEMCRLVTANCET